MNNEVKREKIWLKIIMSTLLLSKFRPLSIGELNEEWQFILLHQDIVF